MEIELCELSSTQAYKAPPQKRDTSLICARAAFIACAVLGIAAIAGTFALAIKVNRLWGIATIGTLIIAFLLVKATAVHSVQKQVRNDEP